MTLTLTLSPEQEQALREKAAQKGEDEREYALHLFNDALGVSSPASGARPFHETATPEEWVKAWHEWTRSHDVNTPVLLNDNREVIYED
jgi:hypothetical protein